MTRLDKIFRLIEKDFPFYKWLIPVNRKEEEHKFIKSNSYNPRYKYTVKRKKLNTLKERIKGIDIPENSMAVFYRKLKQEYLDKLILLENIDDPERFSEVSAQIYGSFSLEDIEFADNILNTFSDDGFIETIKPSSIKKALKEEIKKAGIKGWAIKLKRNIASKVTVKPAEKCIYIKSDYRFFPEEAERLKVHEVRVHLFRAANGDSQEYEIFKMGTAGYLEAEEGLAVYFENENNVCSAQQMKVYAGRLKAVALAGKSSFRKTYQDLNKWFPSEIAYRLCERVKRGITDTSCAGALTKDIHYITGYRKIMDIIKTPDALPALFTGKVGLSDIGLISDLTGKGELKAAGHTP
ncbi:tyrosine/phenylalanine carboxypeptidase domain-containing protein [Elusimicrobiota bacterium]